MHKITITDQLVALFAAAIPHEWAIRRDIVASRRRLSDAKHLEALAAVHRFDAAAGVRPWEHSPLTPRPTNAALQSALVAKLTAADRKTWDAFLKWDRQH